MTKLEYLRKVIDLRPPAVSVAALMEGWQPDPSKSGLENEEDARTFLKALIARMEAQS